MDIDHLDFEAEYDALADPDTYVLLHRGELEAVFTAAEVQTVLSAVLKLRSAERKRRENAPRGLAGAFGRALSGASADVEVLALKLRAVLARSMERQGLGHFNDEVRRRLRPEE